MNQNVIYGLIRLFLQTTYSHLLYCFLSDKFQFKDHRSYYIILKLFVSM